MTTSPTNAGAMKCSDSTRAVLSSHFAFAGLVSAAIGIFFMCLAAAMYPAASRSFMVSPPCTFPAGFVWSGSMSVVMTVGVIGIVADETKTTVGYGGGERKMSRKGGDGVNF